MQEVKEDSESPGEEEKAKELYAEASSQVSSEASSDVQTEGETSEAPKGNVDVYATEYRVWVHNTRISSENKDDVLGDGTVRYEPATDTERAKLILDGLNISTEFEDVETEEYSFIDTFDDLDIILKGNNVIKIEAMRGQENNAIKYVYGITGDRAINIYGEGGGSLTIDIDTSDPTDNLCETYGIFPADVNFVGRNGIFNAKININFKGYGLHCAGIANYTDIINSDINITTDLAYNLSLGYDEYNGLFNLINLNKDRVDRNLNIESSNINIDLKRGQGLGVNDTVFKKAALMGISNPGGEINISGNSSIDIKGTRDGAMFVKKLNLKDTYKVNLEGFVFFRGLNYECGINFENINPDSYFIARIREGDYGTVLYSTDKEDETRISCNIAPEAVVIAGINEESAKFIAPEDYYRLFEYSWKELDNQIEAKYLKLAYNCTINFDANGAWGAMDSVKCVGGSKYILPNCTFINGGYDFKAWEVNGVQYAPGSEIIISGDTLVKAVWQTVSYGGGSGSGGSGGGSGSGGGGGARGGGAIAPKKQSGTWIKDNVGWWYKNADGSYPKASWQKIDNVWYVFNDAGYMVTGWCLSGGKWYYLSASGAMSTGWIQVKDKWYYLETVGKADKPQGSMYALENTPDNYRVNESGEWIR